ncbi:FAD-dependent oxidoreductase [Virgibacillus litoralis]|uniref:Glycine/D-amino acid oxidase-like deaminating enzyme/nitrite reductase/ring-hydroxylating ferredoxin subunit n=1 Tax=Virgibacillus litoralis TaxID=578221 RepID=A0ABS4HIJ6_9BACI|nr:FAD-dependent oxidoreductase [Virgibacillus litoralis]MBP1950742.1 glycine/D-amino acid oxidase-like deaminating enzyme/nitrite reductase/ring-hydroxylating ferredoxin subunit [Virgibacillus litoralis]
MSQNMKSPQNPEPYWRDSVELPSYPSLDKSIKTDVGIVGGGITGITAAYLLAREGVKVTLIDASKILNGTTGHTTAKITAQHGLIYNELIEHFGSKKASLYYKGASEAKKLISDIVTKHKIDCNLKEEDAYIFTNDDSYISQLENEKKAYDQLEIPSELVKNMPLDIPMKSALLMKRQAQFHPLKYLKALLKDSVDNGLEIYENTNAADIEYNKHPSIILKDGNRITCRYVIQASHYPFYDGQGFYPTRMYADRSYVVAGKSNKDYPGGMYINAENPTRSIRIAENDLWLIGGESHKTGQGKSTMDHYNALQEFAGEHFGISEFVNRWSAQDLITLDKVPYIGPLTKAQQSVFVATGFRKWGMTNGTLAAKMITDMILQEDTLYKELYTPSRFQVDPALRQFTGINADVAKHMAKGKMDRRDDNLGGLSPDDATVTRINGQRTGIYKDKEENLYALDTTCTHMKCEVEWNSGDRTWDCPCHGSRFSYTGEVIEGPAKKPLPKVEIE